jgi:putative nucleotidyltransferase with HDIG domain
MLDIDFFKSFNDTYGHQVGDEVLKKISSILKSSVRKTDVAARYGGEELISILIGAESKEAFDVAEKVRTRIENSQLYAVPVKCEDEQKHIVAEKVNDKINILLFPFSDDNTSSLRKHWENLIEGAIKNPHTRSDKDFNIIKLKINASIGVSSFPEDFGLSSKGASILESTNEQDLLIYMADKALYKAKKFGRNRVLTYKGVQEATALGMNKELELETIKKLLLQLKEKDDVTYKHSLRVGKIAEIIAQKMGLNKEEFRLAKYGGFLHDVGKMFIDKNILCKPTDLNEEEYKMIQQHTLKGIGILDQYPVLYKYINAVKLHHEHIDGSGYPEKVSSTRIPIEARVIAVADSFDAMTQYRYYHPKMTLEEINSAIEQIKSQADLLYDKTVIDAFMAEIEKIKTVNEDEIVVD